MDGNQEIDVIVRFARVYPESVAFGPEAGVPLAPLALERREMVSNHDRKPHGPFGRLIW